MYTNLKGSVSFQGYEIEVEISELINKLLIITSKDTVFPKNTVAREQLSPLSLTPIIENLFPHTKGLKIGAIYSTSCREFFIIKKENFFSQSQTLWINICIYIIFTHI